MKTKPILTETRQVCNFHQIAVKGNSYNSRIYIQQSEQEEFALQAPADYLGRVRSHVKNGKLTIRLSGSWLQELEDAFSTCIKGPDMIYRLKVRELSSLEVQCAKMVKISKLETPHMTIRLNGTGEFQLDQLSAKILEIYQFGSGVARVSGRVDVQTIVLTGIGCYMASGLDSQRALVRLSGTSTAQLHVNQELDAILRGMNLLEYSGDPALSQRIAGAGQVSRIERPSQFS